MKKITSDIYSLLQGTDEGISLYKKSKRAAEVKKMWSEIVEDFFLDHTNAVFIIKEDGIKTLIVYVDESIFAAELNGRRELIKLKFLEKFNEEIAEFKILISRGSYKKNYPFKKNLSDEIPSPSIPLTQRELNALEKQVEKIKDPSLKEALKKAMVADLEWKKGINRKNTGTNEK